MEDAFAVNLTATQTGFYPAKGTPQMNANPVLRKAAGSSPPIAIKRH
jgi:hypothetical protein